MDRQVYDIMCYVSIPVSNNFKTKWQIFIMMPVPPKINQTLHFNVIASVIQTRWMQLCRYLDTIKEFLSSINKRMPVWKPTVTLQPLLKVCLLIYDKKNETNAYCTLHNMETDWWKCFILIVPNKQAVEDHTDICSKFTLQINVLISKSHALPHKVPAP
jgi:hypothetical protein